jgi:hypothetical protein
MVEKIKKNSTVIVFFVLVLALSIMIIDSIALPLQASIVCGTGSICMCHCVGSDCECYFNDSGCSCYCHPGENMTCTTGRPPGPPTP